MGDTLYSLSASTGISTFLFGKVCRAETLFGGSVYANAVPVCLVISKAPSCPRPPAGSRDATEGTQPFPRQVPGACIAHPSAYPHLLLDKQLPRGIRLFQLIYNFILTKHNISQSSQCAFFFFFYFFEVSLANPPAELTRRKPYRGKQMRDAAAPCLAVTFPDFAVCYPTRCSNSHHRPFSFCLDQRPSWLLLA